MNQRSRPERYERLPNSVVAILIDFPQKRRHKIFSEALRAVAGGDRSAHRSCLHDQFSIRSVPMTFVTALFEIVAYVKDLRRSAIVWHT